MRVLRALLASLLLVGTLPFTSHAADGDDGTSIDLRPLTDAIHSHIQAMPGLASQADWATAAITDTVEDAAQDAIAAANERYRSQLVRATAIEYLNVAKRELRGVKARQAAQQQLTVTADYLCLHLEVEKKLKADAARLQQEIKYYRGIIGDRRGFFTKGWHRIGPTGRRIVRAFVQEALPIVFSGGSLAGGVARGIGLRAGRQEIKNAIEGRIFANPKLVVILKIHPDADYGRMVACLDELRLANATKVSLKTADR